MIIKSSELAKLLKVTRGTISNWINRDKKIVLNSDKKIDTEDELNKSYLFKKAPFLYSNPTIPTKKPQNKAGTTNNSEDPDSEALPDVCLDNLNDINIDELREDEAKEYLKVIALSDPRKLLLTAQYKKASVEGQLKKLELQEKLNWIYNRDVVHAHFVEILRYYYDQRRKVPYNSVDEVIKMVLQDGESSRGRIVAFLDKKFLYEIEDAQQQLRYKMEKQFPKGEMNDNDYIGATDV